MKWWPTHGKDVASRGVVRLGLASVYSPCASRTQSNRRFVSRAGQRRHRLSDRQGDRGGDGQNAGSFPVAVVYPGSANGARSARPLSPPRLHLVSGEAT